METTKKVGIICCSGEELAGGTLSRLATRKLLEERRPDETVTLCLPLFLAGGQEERAFAKAFPTITVDGCSKLCAKRATERLSGKVNAAIDVSEIVGECEACAGPLAAADVEGKHDKMVEQVADAIEAAYAQVQRPAKAKRITF